MFDSIRTHRRWLMPLLSVVVFLPFVFSGIYGFTRFVSDDNAVAKIDGDSIQLQELEAAHRQRVEALVQRLGNNVDTRMFDTPQMRAATLDNMLSERALTIQASRLHLTAPESVMKEKIAAVPAFQSGGKFDYDTYLRVLAANAYTEGSFEARVREDLSRQALEAGVMAGAIVPHTVIDRLRALDSERRQIRRLAFRPDDFLSKTAVTDEAVKADYDANKEQYRTAEFAKAEYLVLRLDDIAARTPVSEAALHEYYDKNLSRWTGVEQRRASHILITSGKDGSAADPAAAKALAQQLVQQLRVKPGDFARLAREQSKDPGSAAQGGDLGWFGRGAMTKSFEDAVFALKEGQISDVVETNFGFHIIALTGIKGQQPKTFDEVRPVIEGEMRKQVAQKAYAELADQFTNFVYEQSDGLASAAAKFKLPVQTIEHLMRQGAPPDKAKIFTPTVLEAVFAPDSLDKHHNTKAIDIGNNSLVSVHVIEDTPSAIPALDTLKAQIKTKLERAGAAQLARQAGAARLAQLRQDPDDKGFEPMRDLGRQDGQFLPSAAINTIMTLPAEQLPTYVGVDQADGAYAIVHVLSASSAPGPDEAVRAEQQKAITDRIASAEESAYVQALRDRLGAKVLRTDLGGAGSAGKSAKP
jgi:peptidyl-prolyl cis-trans isomerase D